MAYDQFTSIDIEVRDRVAWMTINNPPVNMFDLTLVGEMFAAGSELAQDDDVAVIVMQSADPDFFIAHSDLNLLVAKSESNPSPEDEKSFFHAITEMYRLMPKVTIGTVARTDIAKTAMNDFLTNDGQSRENELKPITFE